MKNLKIMFIVALAVMAFSSVAFANVNVSGYNRADGTHVDSYQRTNPNSTTSDNWSHKGNVNPITGETGYRND